MNVWTAQFEAARMRYDDAQPSSTLRRCHACLRFKLPIPAQISSAGMPFREKERSQGFCLVMGHSADYPICNALSRRSL